MNDVIIIPDIHHKTAIVDEILARHANIERRVFLGDVYDDFGDSPEIARHTAMWHKEMLYDPRNIFLLGNHDATYMSGGFLTCSGYSWAKQAVIDAVMEREDWLRSLLSIEVNGWLLSHAGYHPSLYRDQPGDRKTTEDAALQFVEKHRWQDCPALLEAGRARGGRAEVGGVTWLDWNREFVPIPGVRQIVGHTRGDEPRVNGENVCIDCDLNWYGIIRPDGALDLYSMEYEGGSRSYSIHEFGEARTRLTRDRS